jgi:hypothetical protein
VGQLHPAEGHVRAGRHRQRLGRQGLHQRRAGAAGLRRPRHADLPKDQLDKEGINKAILGIKNYKTDILCKPWYFQDMPVHVPNNTDRTVTPKDGKMVEAEGCTDIPATNADLKTVRAFEAENDVNKG